MAIQSDQRSFRFCMFSLVQAGPTKNKQVLSTGHSHSILSKSWTFIVRKGAHRWLNTDALTNCVFLLILRMSRWLISQHCNGNNWRCSILPIMFLVRKTWKGYSFRFPWYLLTTRLSQHFRSKSSNGKMYSCWATTSKNIHITHSFYIIKKWDYLVSSCWNV